MTDLYLLPLLSNADYDLERALPVALAREMSLEDTVPFCALYRQHGIAVYLYSGEDAHLYAALARSGHAFAAVLQADGWGAVPLSRAAPLLDALASDWTALSALRAVGLPPQAVGYEYEEDYLFVQSLLSLAVDGVGDVEASLSEYAGYVAPDQEPRLAALIALHEGDAEGFNRALAATVDASLETMLALNETLDVTDETVASEGQVSIEGIALARLADARGLPTDRATRNVPDALRVARAATDPRAWTTGFPG